MSHSHIRSRFLSVYDALPKNARRDLLEDYLLPLLDRVSLVDQARVIDSAEKARLQFENMPKLNLAAKRAEVDTLLDELKRDATRGASSSRRDEIYEQIVDSLVSWLSDIWQVAFEYGVNFRLVHKCLLFCSKTLLHITTSSASCKCGFMNMYIPFTIKDRKAEPVKHFSYSGAHYLDEVFLWIWRDMMLKILADGKPEDVSFILQMLQDIESMDGDWTLLSRLIVAGRKIPSDQCDDDTDYEEEETDDDDVQCPNHAAHWSDEILAQLPVLRHKIAHFLVGTFKLTPSLPLQSAIVTLAPTLNSQLLAHLRSTMAYDAAAATAALDIYSLEGDADAVLNILTVAQPVLRPRDAHAMQVAVRMLARTPHAPAALRIVAKELRDCVEVMHGHITATGAFGGVEQDDARSQLTELLRLRSSTHQRQERVERWVDTVVTAPTAGNPLTFAAFLMGFPPGFEPEDIEEPDPFVFAGIKEEDPEYEDLREEWRPRLKERFEGWVQAAETIKSGGQELLASITRSVSETMPYTRGPDIVHEMISRIHDKPTRYHICDALEALSLFMKAQRKKRDSTTGHKSRAGGSRHTRTIDGNLAGSSSIADTHVHDPTMPSIGALD